MTHFRAIPAASTVASTCPLRRRGTRDDANARVFRARDGFETRIDECLIERALAIGRAAKPHEWLALLLGDVVDGSHVSVRELAVDARVDAGPNHVRSTPDSEAFTRAAARLAFPELEVVGWIHGHLGHGARFSSVDHENQRTWSDECAIGIVVDPWSTPEIAVYRGPDAELLREVPSVRRPRATATARAPEHAPSRRRARYSRRMAAVALVLAMIAVVLSSAGVAAFILATLTAHSDGVARDRLVVIGVEVSSARPIDVRPSPLRTEPSLPSVAESSEVVEHALPAHAPAQHSIARTRHRPLADAGTP